ncbi:MAG: glycoside hydrolase family 3 C-terminal domain-containing protein [Anaerolineales bacterium]|nr:glycoside hydrolase family 3 C-terminal domain-containing protein [Anaerolineales bacterium]
MLSHLRQALGHKLLLGFEGHTVSDELADIVRQQTIGGFTLFRHKNIETAAQTRALTAHLQNLAQAAGHPPLLIGIDQEGGQLMALGEGTAFPGNMALGATRSAELAYRTGVALGREVAAVGANINYAPVCDVNVNPRNPVVGTRSFGEEAVLVAQLGAAMVRGLQAAGVAAAPKHFPGHGDTASDSHYGAPVILHDEARLRRVEWPPFVAAIEAGAKMVMTAHVAIPALNGGVEIPATLSAPLLNGYLRRELGFAGVIISDALDMHAITQGAGMMIDVLAATLAGVDLLLFTDYASALSGEFNAYAALVQAAQRQLLPAAEIFASAQRIIALKTWVAQQPQPALEVVGCAEHLALAREIAERSVTLVKDEAGRLPLRLAPEAKVLAIVPRPADLTPADTSSYVTPTLAHALRQYHPYVEELIIPIDPSETEVAALRELAAGCNLVVVGTLNATVHAGQAALVQALLRQAPPVIVVALRLPYDLQAFPNAPTYVCTYSLHAASMHALARGLWGELKFTGQLPVSILE